jgi:hypothetical protein
VHKKSLNWVFSLTMFPLLPQNALLMFGC